uniref:Uncharacterized protein n=1 Tax=Arundo donax TaxID=35708 RepID=A0A0A9I4W4_ARUDO
MISFLICCLEREEKMMSAHHSFTCFNFQRNRSVSVHSVNSNLQHHLGVVLSFYCS